MALEEKTGEKQTVENACLSDSPWKLAPVHVLYGVPVWEVVIKALRFNNYIKLPVVEERKDIVAAVCCPQRPEHFIALNKLVDENFIEHLYKVFGVIEILFYFENGTPFGVQYFRSGTPCVFSLIATVPGVQDVLYLFRAFFACF